MNRYWTIYYYRNKLYIPSFGHVKGGPYFSIRPVRIIDLEKVIEFGMLDTDLRNILNDRYVVLPEDFDKRIMVDVYKEAKTHSYKQFIKDSIQWSIEELDEGFQLSRQKSDKTGAMYNDDKYSAKFPNNMSEDKLVEVLKKEIAEVMAVCE